MLNISLRIQSSLAQCLGVNISVDPPIFIDKNQLSELGGLGLSDAQLYTFIYQKIKEESCSNGLYKLKTEKGEFNLRLENKEVGEEAQQHLRLIKRPEMIDNAHAVKVDTASANLQARVKETDKKTWDLTAKEQGFNGLSAWVIHTLNQASETHFKEKDVAS